MDREYSLKRISSYLNTNALVDADREAIFRLIRKKYPDRDSIKIRNKIVYVPTNRIDDALIKEVLELMDARIQINDEKLSHIYR